MIASHYRLIATNPLLCYRASNNWRLTLLLLFLLTFLLLLLLFFLHPMNRLVKIWSASPDALFIKAIDVIGRWPFFASTLEPIYFLLLYFDLYNRIFSFSYYLIRSIFLLDKASLKLTFILSCFVFLLVKAALTRGVLAHVGWYERWLWLAGYCIS